MTQYKVISDNCTLGAQGATIDGTGIDENINVAALVDGGHLAQIGSRVVKQDDTVKDK